MTPAEIKSRLTSCETTTDLELALSEMRVPDIKLIIDTFTAMQSLSDLTMRDEYVLLRAKWVYNKMAGNLTDPVTCKQQ